MNTLYRIFGSAVMLATMLGSSALIAQQPQQAPPATPPVEELGPQGYQVDDRLKEKFVAAYVDVISIQNEYSEKLENAANENEVLTLQQRAQEEMQAVVIENDLSIEEYNRVIQFAAINDELRAELEAAIKQAEY